MPLPATWAQLGCEPCDCPGSGSGGDTIFLECAGVSYRLPLTAVAMVAWSHFHCFDHVGEFFPYEVPLADYNPLTNCVAGSLIIPRAQFPCSSSFATDFLLTIQLCGGNGAGSLNCPGSVCCALSSYQQLEHGGDSDILCFQPAESSYSPLELIYRHPGFDCLCSGVCTVTIIE